MLLARVASLPACHTPDEIPAHTKFTMTITHEKFKTAVVIFTIIWRNVNKFNETANQSGKEQDAPFLKDWDRCDIL